MKGNEKREAIRLKVVEAIPEILELKFGCTVMTTDGERKLISDSCLSSGFSGYRYTVGRPILAQDIVKTLGQFYLISGKGDLLEHAGFGNDSMREHKFNRICRIDLSKNLSTWSPETIEELYKLMCE